MIKNKESSYPKYLDVKNLCRWAMSQKLPVNKFVWIEENSQYNEHFIKNYKEESGEGYFLEIDVQYSGKLNELHNDLPCLPQRKKIKKENRRSFYLFI